MKYREVIQSHRWRTGAVRLGELAAAGQRCRLCFAAGTARSPLHVHHATYVRLGCEAPGDVTTLCAECHREVECFLRRRRYAARKPPRADYVSTHDKRRPLFDPTR
jgi:hypothetical protein